MQLWFTSTQDGTESAPILLWRDKISAIKGGFFKDLKNNSESIFINVIPCMVWNLHHQRWKPKNIKIFSRFLRKQVKSCKSMFTLTTCPGCIPSLSPYVSWDRLQHTHDPERVGGREWMDRCLHLKVCILYEYLHGVLSMVNWSPRRLNRKSGRTSQPWTSVLIVMLMLASQLSAVADIYQASLLQGSY